MTVKKDPNDKYAEYDFGLHCNESHQEDEIHEEDGKVNDWHERHKDKVLDDFCDTHPGSPQCKVFDD
tara:strand:+ start:1788 stop:1988 length:201 start_codon:yes stop_codon:yes gene_type:complete